MDLSHVASRPNIARVNRWVGGRGYQEVARYGQAYKDRIVAELHRKDKALAAAVLNAIESRLHGYGVGKVSPECHSLRGTVSLARSMQHGL